MIPEFMKFALTIIYPNITNGCTYGITTKSLITPYLSDLENCPEIKLIQAGDNSYIICMSAMDIYKYAMELMPDVKLLKEDIENFTFKPKLKDLATLDKYLESNRNSNITIGIYSVNATDSMVRNGICYIGFNLTYEDILPYLSKYNCQIKVNNAAANPKDVLPVLYNNPRIKDCFEISKTNTGVFLTIHVN